MTLSRSVSDQDLLACYAAAEAVLEKNVTSLVLNEAITPHWVSGDVFWYRRGLPKGAEYVWVENGAKRPAFDHPAVAGIFSDATGATVNPLDLVVESISAGGELVLLHGDHRWRVDEGSAVDLGPVEVAEKGVLVSPNGDHGLISRDHDLFLRDLKTGTERRLTDDGEEDFSWGEYPDAGFLAVARRRDGLSFAPYGWSWSPDGQFLVGGRLDERHIEPYPFLESVSRDGNTRPRVYAIRQPVLGEPGPVFSGCVIEVATGRRIAIDLDVALGLDPSLPGLGEIEPVGWSADHRRLFAAASLPYAKATLLYEIEVTTGAARLVIKDPADGFLKVGSEIYKQASIRMLAGGREAIWYSERSGYGHLYRYDLASGALLNPITSGEWLVRDILKVDEDQGRVYFTASGREGGDPYQRRVYRVNLDGTDLVLIGPEQADHTLDGPPISLLSRLYNLPIPPVRVSPDGTVFIDTWSTVSTPSTSVLRSTEDGTVILPLEDADASALYATGWRPPEPFVAKAADGLTDLYGVIYRPHAESDQPSPVVDGIYGGPQVTVTPRNFLAARYGLGGQGRGALAALGFAVVVVDGRGTPLRSRTFQDAGYTGFADVCLDDHVAVLRQLCERDPRLDAERIGVYGHSFGGYTSARAILRHPDVYKVAVSSAGSHNLHGMYAGIAGAGPLPDYGHGARFKPNPSSVPKNYAAFDTAALAANLRGRLLLVYGDMDENAFPAVTFQLCDALNRANRSYDLLCFPNATHGFTAEPYFIRRLWDYLSEHLMGQKPPEDYAIGGQRGQGGFG